MSVAVDFERTLIQLLNNRKNNSYDDIDINNTSTDYKEQQHDEHSENESKYEMYDSHNVTVAPAVSLFAGRCIGIGLASHSLIIQWK